MTLPPMLITVLEVLVAASLFVAAAFIVVGALGFVRFRDFYMRLHAPTKVSTLGVGGVLLASILAGWLDGRPGIHELLITLFVFLTAPVSANLLAKAALHLRLRSEAPLPEEIPGDVSLVPAPNDDQA
jgi:multicomponent K+:H+ antiporter subunit G